MKEYPSHKRNLDALRRAEGQIRGVQKMITEKRYCIDILTQLSAVSSAIGSIQDSILSKHLDTCVKGAFHDASKEEKKAKIDEVIKMLKTYRKNG